MNPGSPDAPPSRELASAGAPIHSDPPSIPDHELLKCIGRGSYGEVWLARNVFGDYRAVKIVYRSTFEDDRPFEREFEGIRRFEPISRSHPSQLNILHVGREEGCFYYVMELADPVISNQCSVISRLAKDAATGSLIPDSLITDYSPKTLRAVLRAGGRLPPAECVEIGLALTTALAHLHAHRLVHRDIKPSNIIFVGGVPKLADIGLVTDVDASRSFVGTEGFLPPEGPGTPQADLYSLGKVLYEMSTGRDRKDYPGLPLDWDALDPAEQARLLEWNEVLVKVCEADPRRRYQTAEKLLAELELLQRGESVKAKRVAQQRWAVAQKLAVFMATLVALAGTFWIASRPAERQRVEGHQVRQQKSPSPAAQRLYEQARSFGRNTKEGVNKSIEFFNRAILEDPDFAEAYAHLAQVYVEAAGWHFAPKQAMMEAKKNVTKALQLDDSLPEAHMTQAGVLWRHDWDWGRAEAEYRRAIQLDPRRAWSYASFGFMLAEQGRFPEADDVLRLADQLDPKLQMVVGTVSWRYFFERRYDDALAQGAMLRTLYTNDIVGYMIAAFARERLGHYAEALDAVHAARKLDWAPDILT